MQSPGHGFELAPFINSLVYRKEQMLEKDILPKAAASVILTKTCYIFTRPWRLIEHYCVGAGVQ
jgi:hypothetical protein